MKSVSLTAQIKSLSRFPFDVFSSCTHTPTSRGIFVFYILLESHLRSKEGSFIRISPRTRNESLNIGDCCGKTLAGRALGC